MCNRRDACRALTKAGADALIRNSAGRTPGDVASDLTASLFRRGNESEPERLQAQLQQLNTTLEPDDLQPLRGLRRNDA